MRVTVDRGLCQGHAMCELEAPGVFGYDRDSNQVRILAEHPDESERDAVRRAVTFCPSMALAIED